MLLRYSEKIIPHSKSRANTSWVVLSIDILDVNVKHYGINLEYNNGLEKK